MSWAMGIVFKDPIDYLLVVYVMHCYNLQYVVTLTYTETKLSIYTFLKGYLML